MDHLNRRVFLKNSALAGSVVLLRSMPGFAAASLPASTIKAWRTSTGEKFHPIEPPAWQAAEQAAEQASASSIHIDPERKYQRLLGFGAALTEASCYLLEQTDASRRRAILSECFGANGLSFSVARTTIGSSDYSLAPYTYDDTQAPDPELKHFSISHDDKNVLPLLREARQVNPELFYFSSPWSPPAWMKAGGTLLGGSMRKHYFAAYAQYFVKFLQGYAAAGVNIDAVTVQNEVDTDQDGRMPQALWGQEFEIEFVNLHLGPALQQAGLKTKIWVLDHNYNLWGRAVDELSDPLLYRYVDGIAWHGYVGAPSEMSRVHDMFPDKNAYWTEGGPDYTEPDYATNWVKWSSTFTGILRNWARCIVSWNLVLDEQGKPDIGPFNCGGVVTLNSKTGAITRSGQFHAFAHYSRTMKRGAQIVASSGTLPNIDHVAAINSDGSFVLVLTNGGDEQLVRCLLEGKSMSLTLPTNSVTTLEW